MKKKLLIESSNNVEFSKIKDNLYFEGIFAKSDYLNLNGRIYPRKVMEESINEYNEQYVKMRRSLGELGHPDTSSINFDRVAYLIESPLILQEDGSVYGKGKILKNLPMGKIAFELFNEGITLGISTRGLGSVKEVPYKEDPEMMVEEVEDYELIAFDLVDTPSSGSYLPNNKVKKEEVEKEIEKMIKEEKELKVENFLELFETLLK